MFCNFASPWINLSFFFYDFVGKCLHIFRWKTFCSLKNLTTMRSRWSQTKAMQFNQSSSSKCKWTHHSHHINHESSKAEKITTKQKANSPPKIPIQTRRKFEKLKKHQTSIKIKKESLKISKKFSNSQKIRFY